jgi:hypothetical protein
MRFWYPVDFVWLIAQEVRQRMVAPFQLPLE